MIRIGIVTNPLDPTSWEEVEVAATLPFLKERFGSWPEQARIYDMAGFGDWTRAAALTDPLVLASRDVTPRNGNVSAIERLGRLPGPLLVTIPPADPVTAIIAVVAVAVGALAAFLLVPKIPSLGNQQSQSPNNSLADRSNKPRPNGRIPDIYGLVRSVPDLLAVPYTIFEDNLEIEVAFMAVGRGSYDISDVRDGDTLISAIAGAGVSIYAPYTSPNSGDAPQLQIGTDIEQAVLNVVRLNEVNGQTLRAPNSNAVKGNENIRFVAPDTIEATGDIDFASKFDRDDVLLVQNAGADGGFTTADPSFNLNGSYTVLSATNNRIVLSNPAQVNPAWTTFGDATAYGSPALSTSGERWVGPFVVEAASTQRLLANFAALNGLYKEGSDKKGNSNQTAFPITVQVEATPVSATDQPIGAPQTFSVIVAGNAEGRDSRFASLWAAPSFQGRMSVRARRVTPSDLTFKGTVVDEVKWRDLYGVSDVTVLNYGNVTTIHSRTYATNSALSVKERKLNLLAARRLPRRVDGATFTDELYATRNAADILTAMCLDPFIGGRTTDDLDLDNVFDTIAQVEAHFGSAEATHFDYTFDDDQISFEETVGIVAQNTFCIPYRQGRMIRLSFERATEDSVLLFNHRNVLPDTQERSVRFGRLNDQDGVELDYINPSNDVTLTYYIPTDRSAANPRTLQLPGIRSYALAYWQAWRAYNRMLYQNVATQLEATQEAALVIRNDRVLISDMTRPQRFDGEVEGQDGATLLLSEPADLDPDQTYTIFLQHIDATVEALGVTAGADEGHVVLSSAPRLPLATDEALALGGAKYTIVAADDVQTRAFLVTTREPESNFTESLQAVNYSFLYYQNDQLLLWLPFFDGTGDLTAWQQTVTKSGDVPIVPDDQRQKPVAVVNGQGALAAAAVVSPVSYTKAAWLNISVSGGVILGNDTERFGLTDNQLIAGNNGNQIAAALPRSPGWHHYAVTYDADARQLRLYIDGKPAAQADGIDRGARPAGLSMLTGYIGKVDDVRLYTRALSRTELGSIYRATVFGTKISTKLLTEGGQVLTTEEGGNLLWE